MVIRPQTESPQNSSQGTSTSEDLHEYELHMDHPSPARTIDTYLPNKTKMLVNNPQNT